MKRRALEMKERTGAGKEKREMMNSKFIVMIELYLDGKFFRVAGVCREWRREQAEEWRMAKVENFKRYIYEVGKFVTARKLLTQELEAEFAEVRRETVEECAEGYLEILEDALADVIWLDKNAAGRRSKDDEPVWNKLNGMKSRLTAAIEAIRALLPAATKETR